MTDFRTLRESSLAERIQNIVTLTGAHDDNLTLDQGEQPWEPWRSSVMVLAGAADIYTPWLWLGCRDCGWFLGFASQCDPAALAEAAQRHRDGCPGSAQDGEPS